MRKRYLIMIIAVMLILAGCSNNSPTGHTMAEDLPEVSVRLPIPVVRSAFAPFYSAIDQGFYEEQGIKVTYHLGSSETNPARMVASGADDFGVLGGPDTMLVARSRGQSLVAMAIMHKDASFPVLITKKDSGIKELSDLNGKKIGFYYGHISTDVLHRMLNKYNIDYEEVDVGFSVAQLISDQIDAQWYWRINAVDDLQKQGVDIRIFSPEDYGVPSHGYTIFTTEEMIEENPELVEKFLRGTFKGIQYTIDNPLEAYKSIYTRAPTLDHKKEYRQQLDYNKVMTGNNGYPIGYMDYDMFKETYDRLEKEDVLESEYDVGEAFTLKFLERIHKND